MNTINKLIEGFFAETPIIAKWIRNAMALVSGVIIAIMMALQAAGCNIPGWLDVAYPYAVSVSAAVAFICQFRSKKDE